MGSVGDRCVPGSGMGRGMGTGPELPCRAGQVATLSGASAPARGGAIASSRPTISCAYRVNALGSKIASRSSSRRRHACGEQLAERRPRVPGALRVLLDDPVGVVARHARLDQRQQRALRVERAVGDLEVLEHAVLVHDHAVRRPGWPATARSRCRIVASGRATRSAPECEMSRSCQRATFSSARLRVAAQQPRDAGDPLGDDRVALVRHRRRALLLARAERLLDLAHLGALEVADLGGEALEARAGERDRLEQLGVAVARDDLGRDRLGAQVEPREHAPLEVRRRRRVGADRAGDRADARLPERPLEPVGVAVRLEGEAGQLDAERRRLGLDAVRAARRTACPRARARGAASASTSSRAPRRMISPAACSWSASAVSSTSDEVSPKWIQRPASPADALKHVDERGDVVVGDLLALLRRPRR